MILLFFTAITKFCFGLSIYLGAIKASLLLHNNLLSHILRWSVGMFDITPIGRIVNRCGYDIDVVDNIIIRNFESVLNHVGTVGVKNCTYKFCGKI